MLGVVGPIRCQPFGLLGLHPRKICFNLSPLTRFLFWTYLRFGRDEGEILQVFEPCQVALAPDQFGLTGGEQLRNGRKPLLAVPPISDHSTQDVSRHFGKIKRIVFKQQAGVLFAQIAHGTVKAESPKKRENLIP